MARDMIRYLKSSNMSEDSGNISSMDMCCNGVRIKKESEDDDNTNIPCNTKRARLIVRNLPFKNLSEDNLRQWFNEYGHIIDVKLLKKDDGQFKGCGFIEFMDVKSAAKAVNEANRRRIHGREIIVDWAVPKHVYVESLKTIKQEMKQEVIDVHSEDSLSGDELPYTIDTAPDPNNSVEKNSFQWNNQYNDEDLENGPDEHKKLNKKKLIKSGYRNENSKISFKSSDVETGKTLFVRNIPFSATNDDLRNCFSKFGELEYALICVDKLTEHSKGSGFVKFKDKENADRCLLQNNNILMGDKPLLLTTALSKESLQNIKDKKIPKDSRNLYLAKEGVVVAGSGAAHGVSAADMAKRLQIEQWKTQMLKNLNMFLSRTRLIIHNLPNNYSDAQLKALFLKHTHPKAVITEAKVMRDKKKFDQSGLGLSKEFGFVTFENHEDALLALRNINNNPKIFSVKKRPIVAFSVESKVALNAKKKRLERSRIKLGIDDRDKMNKLMHLNRKQRRHIRRKQKFIEKRREAKSLVQESQSDKKEKTQLVNLKRKMEETEIPEKGKKKPRKESMIDEAPTEFCGSISNPGKKVKLRARLNVKNQVSIHKKQMREEKKKKIKKAKRKLENIKQPKQSRGGKNPKNDDKHLSKLIKKHRKALEDIPRKRKWDEQ